MTEIAIEVSDERVSSQLEKMGREADSFASERRGMDGVSLFTVIMTLGPLLIEGIVEIVQAQIKARKHVRVLIDGVEICGVSESTLLEILKAKQIEKSSE